MCGRFALTPTPEEVAAFFALMDLESFPPRYNIAPTQPVLLVIDGPRREPGSNLPRRRAMLVRWGLVPAWAKSPRDIPLLINARAESAAGKPAFRNAMRHRRALIPASGFYEWRRGSGPKGNSQAFWMRPRDNGVIAFAALMETFAEPGGSEIDTGAILTTSASADIAAIHDRMPVVIAPRDFSRWLDCRDQEPRDVVDLLRGAPPGFFEPIPVSDGVNKVANTGPEIQDRMDVPPSQPATRPASIAAPAQMKLF